MSDSLETPDTPEKLEPTPLHSLGFELAKRRLHLLSLNLLLLLVPLAAALVFAIYGRSDRLYLNQQINVAQITVQQKLHVTLQQTFQTKVIPDAHKYIDARLRQLGYSLTGTLPQQPTQPEPAPETTDEHQAQVEKRIGDIESKLEEGRYAARLDALELQLIKNGRVVKRLEELERRLGPPRQGDESIEQRLRQLEERLGEKANGETRSLEARITDLDQRLSSIDERVPESTVTTIQARLDKLDKPQSPLQKKLADMDDSLKDRATTVRVNDVEKKIQDQVDTQKNRADTLQKKISAVERRESRVLILKESTDKFSIDGLNLDIALGSFDKQHPSQLKVTITRGAANVFSRQVTLGKATSFEYEDCTYSLLVYRAASVILLKDFLEVVVDKRCAEGS